jgi:hypothetical protein
MKSIAQEAEAGPHSCCASRLGWRLGNNRRRGTDCWALWWAFAYIFRQAKNIRTCHFAGYPLNQKTQIEARTAETWIRRKNDACQVFSAKNLVEIRSRAAYDNQMRYGYASRSVTGRLWFDSEIWLSLRRG